MSTVQERIPVQAQPPPQILVMEDEINVAKGLELVLTEDGYTVDLAATGQSAMDSLEKKGFDLLVADLRLPDIDGMEVIRRVKEKQPETEVVIITGYASVPSAVNAMKLGVYDYLPKPFTEKEIRDAVHGALKEKQKEPKEKIRFRVETEEEKLIQKREVIRVLNRTADDNSFWRELMETGSAALEAYSLSPEAKAAIASGDLGWINENIGELTQKQLMFIYKRLEREAW